MKIIKLLTLLVLFSLQAGATGYSHNMFVAHKKLQSGKECRIANDQIAVKKQGTSKINVKHASVPRKPGASFTQEVAKKLSGMVTLNQSVLEETPSLFSEEDEKESDGSIVTKLVSVVKGIVYAFVSSSSFGKA